MKYLKKFHKKLHEVRMGRQLSVADIAKICEVDDSVVAAWEEADDARRCYPSVQNLVDLSLVTGLELSYFVDVDLAVLRKQQLDLPGLQLPEPAQFDAALEQLDALLDQLVPTAAERKLMLRFRNMSEEKRQLVLSLIAE